MKRNTLIATVLAATFALAVTACGGDDAAAPTSTTSTSTSTVTARPTQDVDRLVQTDHGRMQLRCTGSGNTTVVLVAGWDGGDGTWNAIEPDVAENARVCSYAKLGTGASDSPSTLQTFATQADDLHDLLIAADEPGPYVVLGHSFGGSVAATFASKHAEEVTGLLLLDASPPTWPATVCSVPSFQSVCDLFRDPAKDAERLDVFRAFDEVAHISSLGDLPMTVMTAAHRDGTGLTPQELQRLDDIWAAGQRHWSTLSTASHMVTVEHTGHHIELDQPAMVVAALLALLR